MHLLHKKLVFTLATLLCIVSSSSLHAKLEDHFKKAEGKTDIHKMKNIDFIYMINLDQRPEKYALSCELLSPYGIYPYRFSAVNGWELSIDTLNDVGLKFEPDMKKGIWGTSYIIGENQEIEHFHEIIQNPGQTYFAHCLARGAIGCALSHLSVLQDAYDSGYETIWVIEDDILIVQDPNILSDLIQQLDKKVGKKNWDILCTDQDTRNSNGQYVRCSGIGKRPNFNPKSKKQYYERKKVGNKFILKGARFGTYSMIVRRSGMKKILNFIKKHKIFFPYDMEFNLAEGLQMYCLTNDVVAHQPVTVSDNGAPNYLKNFK